MRKILATLAAILYITLFIAAAFLAERITPIPMEIPVGVMI